VDRSGFLKLITREFYPLLRAEGFRGAGTTLRRIQEPIIHVFNFQGSTSEHGCYLNLGAHLSFIPTEGGSAVQPASILEYHCVFRGRIDPPPGQSFPWSYGSSDEDAAENVAFLVSEWPTQGRPFFDRYSKYPESFITLVSGVNPNEVDARDCLHFARIARQLNMPDRAATFLHVGLAKAPEQATLLRADLTGLLRSLGNNQADGKPAKKGDTVH
jgi:hypothetical protein